MNKKKIKLVGFFIIALIMFLPITKVNAFEKPLKNSTGFPTCNLTIRSDATSSSSKKGEIPAGKPFLILEEKGDWWKITYNSITGYVYHPYCMINLPDVEPSIIYEIANASGNLDRASGRALDITGKKLYTAGKVQNSKLGRAEYIVPVLYSTAQKISKAQENANKEGFTLKIYDAYRPMSVSKIESDSLNRLYKQDATVRANINKNGWSSSWFLATGISTHNVGAAIDVSLASNSTRIECKMPTAMSEISADAAKYKGPNSTEYNSTMNDYAIKLDRYCTSAGLNILKSEWWHFQENDGYNRIKKLLGTGCNFQVTSVVSKEMPRSTQVNWAVNKNILRGIGNGNLDLYSPLKRADAFVLLYRMDGESLKGKTGNISTGFTDVAKNAYYAEAVIWGKNKNIVKGTGNSQFSPNSLCTRGTLVTFLYRYHGEPATTVSKNYSSIASFNKPTNWALNVGIINQTMANSIDKAITREETINILYNYYQKYVAKK